MTDTTTHELIIIGSGPAGYTAAVYAARAGLAPLVLAGSVTAGGALMNTTDVENFPGFPDGILGPELMENLQKQAEKFGAAVEYDDAVELRLAGDVKTVVTGNGATYTSPAVILATGSAYRELGLPDEKRLSGRGVSWCATCDGFFFRDQRVVVVGGGDSAMEEATFLTRFASTVLVVHRRDELRASKIMADRALADPKIEFVWNSEVAAIHGADKLTGLTLRDTVTGEQRDLAADGLFVAIGHVPRSELLAGQVALDDEGYVLTGQAVDADRSTATSLAGVFACGDLVDHTYRQAITAAGTGCAASLDAQHYLAARADAAAAAITDSPPAAAELAGAGETGAAHNAPAVSAPAQNETVNAAPEPVRTTVAVTDESFPTAVLGASLPVLVDFWAPWCGPCRAVAPVLEELAEEYAGRIIIAKMNTDENPSVPMAYGVTSIPTMNVYRGGEVVQSLVGARPKPALKQTIEEILAG